MGVRGKRVHELLLFADMQQQPERDDGTVQRGRSLELVAARNERLLHRFIYYTRLYPKYSYEAHLVQLAMEFDLSTVTVGDIINDNQGQLAALRRDWPEVKELKRRWPWLVW